LKKETNSLVDKYKTHLVEKSFRQREKYRFLWHLFSGP